MEWNLKVRVELEQVALNETAQAKVWSQVDTVFLLEEGKVIFPEIGEGLKHQPKESEFYSLANEEPLMF